MKVYSEDGGQFVVELLADTTTDGMREVKLRHFRTIKPSPVYGDIPRGMEFEASVLLGYEAYVGWELRDAEPGELPS